MKKFRYLIILILPLLALIVSRAFAQKGEAWSQPLNLSHSGSATDPHSVVDAWGRIHVLWQDEYAGLVYTQGNQDDYSQVEGWTTPVSVSLPFENALASLIMVPDSQGLIHAAWLDADGNLFYSRVPGQSFDQSGAWSSPLLLAVSTADFSMAAAPDGKIHFGFLRNTSTADFPAGIYTRFNYGSSDIWSLPRLVYTSPYLRGLDASQAQLSLAPAADGHIYLAWDETPQEKIYLAVSSDGGDIWTDPQELDSRQPSDGGSTGPAKPNILTQNGSVMLTWQAGHQGTNCSHYFRKSADGGNTWFEPERLPAPFDQSCAQRVQIIQNPTGETWLALTNPTGLYLLAYDGIHDRGTPWSTPSLQTQLNGFINPETYRAVSLACRDVNLIGEILMVSACERDNELGDIWLLTRSMGETATWFPTPTPEPPWSTPEVMASSQGAFNQPALASDPPGRLHAFWTRESDGSIYYALWDGERWSTATSLFNSPGGAPQDLSALLHPSGQLFLAWSDPEAGEIYLSHASNSQALAPSAWSAPLPVATAGMSVVMTSSFSGSQLALAGDGTLLLVYVVPFNEGRGVYIQRSLPPTEVDTNPGSTWSQAELVFDAAAAGWASLSEPYLAILPDGSFEIMWTRRDVPPGMQALGLYRAHSRGQAATGSPNVSTGWSEAVQVLRGETIWSQLMVDVHGMLQRAWQQITAEQPVLLHQVSSDGGMTWSEAVRITGLQNTEGPVAMAAGTDGSLNLVQFEPGAQTENSVAAAWELHLWRWEGAGAWQELEGQPAPGISQPEAVSLGLSGDGKLMTLFSGNSLIATSPEAGNTSGDSDTDFLLSFMARRDILESDQANSLPSGQFEDSPDIAQVSTATPEAEATQTGTPGATEVVVPTDTVVLSNQPPGIIQKLFASSYSALAVGLLPAVLVVLVLFIIVILRRK